MVPAAARRSTFYRATEQHSWRTRPRMLRHSAECRRKSLIRRARPILRHSAERRKIGECQYRAARSRHLRMWVSFGGFFRVGRGVGRDRRKCLLDATVLKYRLRPGAVAAEFAV